MWAVYALINILATSDRPAVNQLAGSWAKWFLYARSNARGIFMWGPQGDVCAVTALRPEVDTSAPRQNYACERDDCLNNDPFEGELMTWILYFSSMLNTTEAASLWTRKRPQLLATNYTGSIVDGSNPVTGKHDYSGEPLKGRHIRPITTQKGLHFASNEQTKLLFLPYRDVEVVSKVYMNAEYVRTCNSVLMGSTPGLFSRCLNATLSTDSGPNRGIEGPWIQNAGIPSAAVFEEQELDMVTPSAVFPTILFDRAVGLAWYKNMVDGKQMQSVLGNLAGRRRDGCAVARVGNWETKAPILISLLGGIVDIIRDAMVRDNIYDEFIRVTEQEYGNVFDPSRNGGAPLVGQSTGLCLPDAQIDNQTLDDFSTCNSMP